MIDFTNAYYDLGLRVLYNVKDDVDKFTFPDLFLFLKPYDTNSWLLILASTIIVSVGLAIIGRLSPYGWYQKPPDDFSLWEARFQMTFYNSVWLSLSAILQQGKLKRSFYITYSLSLYTHITQVQKQHQGQLLQEF